MNKKPLRKPYIRYAFATPVFHRNGKPTGEAVWAESVYYWWWAYLRRNDDYLRAFSQRDLNPYYSAYLAMDFFGDVTTDDFKTWWQSAKRGEELFAEPEKWNTLKSIPPFSKDPYLADKDMLIIKVPLHLPQTYLKKAFSDILKSRHKGKKGKRYGKFSRALYKINGTPKVKALAKTLKVYDEHNLPSKPSHAEIATKFRLVKEEHFIGPDDTPMVVRAKKRIMSSTVSRYLLNAEKMIHNAALGSFPDLTDFKLRAFEKTADSPS